MPRPSLRQRILEAAAEVASEKGGTQFTLETVAERAGVSKGGLLYHFRSKELLMKGLLENLVDTIENRLVEVSEQVPTDPENTPFLPVLARILAAGEFRESRHLNHALITAAVAHPEMIGELRPRFLEQYRKVQKHEDALVLFLAIEGLVFLETMGLSPFARDPEFQEVMAVDPWRLLLKKTKAHLPGSKELES